MLQNWQNILIKILSIILFIILFYKLSNSMLFNNNSNDSFETFKNSIENEKINYLKLNETYIDPEDVSLELLYANYLGEEVNNYIWENKTIDQCTDLCNNIKGCIGFTRDLVLDTEPGNCYPKNTINKCYSNRKGNLNQMQNAIKYNSFIKSNFPNVLNLCIGDTNLTLNRTIFIKSYSMPNKCLGVNNDSRITMIENNANNFKTSCNFRIEKGLDGVGTVSFYHIDTGKYIFRDSSNILILKDNTSKQTENNQRSSFNLYDSNIGSGGIILKSMLIEGETTDKFITIDDNYLNVISLENDDSLQNSTFYIVDYSINSNIITNKNKIPNSTSNNSTSNNSTSNNSTSNNSTLNNSTLNNSTLNNSTSNNSTSNNSTSNNSTLNNSTSNNSTLNNSTEAFTDKLDSTNDILLYNKIFNPKDNISLNNYLQDNYTPDYKNSPLSYSISNKINDTVINKQLTQSLTNNQEEYNSYYELNKEIEKEILNLNLGINAKNDKLINNLNNMRISDMANDYFFLKTLSKNNK